MPKIAFKHEECCQVSNSRSDCSSPSSLSGCGSKTESTEDLWSEDREEGEEQSDLEFDMFKKNSLVQKIPKYLILHQVRDWISHHVGAWKVMLNIGLQQKIMRLKHK